MKTKRGETVPDDLAAELEKKQMVKQWGVLRPSCQADYVELVEKAKTGEIRDMRIKRVLDLTSDYYKRHPEKHKE